MATAKIPQRVKLMEVQQIAGFSADYLMQAFKQHPDETQLNTIITLCSNQYPTGSSPVYSGKPWVWRINFIKKNPVKPKLVSDKN